MSTTSTSSTTGMKVQTIENVASVRDIGWEEGSDNITVTTDSQVCVPTLVCLYFNTSIIPQVLQYPLERCSESATCGECTGENSFPLCGWCTVEDKCSRRSQCLNSSQSGRWVQSSSDCISTTVSPSKFILDSPTIVNGSM